MSDKPFGKLNPVDRRLRRAFPAGVRGGVDVTIELVVGFELFNTRPHHNHETWGNGYRVTGAGLRVEAEDLDDAVNLFCDLVEGVRPVRPWHRLGSPAGPAPTAADRQDGEGRP